jgi:integrase
MGFMTGYKLGYKGVTMATFNIYENAFTVKYLKFIGIKQTPYYQRRIPTKLVERLGKKHFKIRLEPSQGSLASQVSSLAKSHDALFKGLEEHPEAKLPTERDAARKLLYNYGLKEGQGIKPIPRSQLPKGVSDTPHLDEFFADYQQDLERGVLTPTQELAYKALKSPLPLMLSELFNLYVELEQKDARWVVKQKRIWNRFLAIVGDMPVNTVDRSLSRKYIATRESETVKRHNEKGVVADQPVKSGTIEREINFLRATFNRTLLEIDENIRNPFTRTRSTIRGKDAATKEILNSEEFASLIDYCKTKNDALATAILMMAFSGARISEVISLRKKDVHLDADIPYFTVTEYGEHSIKTANSARNIPIHRTALQLVRAQYERAVKNGALFPQYNNMTERPKADAAGATINKRLGILFKEKHITSHSFRHQILTAFRNSGVPRDHYEQFTGHNKQTTSDNYGVDRDLDNKKKDLLAAINYQLRPVVDQAAKPKSKPSKKVVSKSK